MPRGDWPEVVVERMKTLWVADEHSAREIAEILNSEFGTTFRGNAVIGKANKLKIRKQKAPPPLRTKLPREKVTVRMAPSIQSKRPVRLVRTPPRAIDTAPPESPSASQYRGAEAVLALTKSTCKWPIGDPSSSDFCFCGHTARDGKPYCGYHARQAYQPNQKGVR